MIRVRSAVLAVSRSILLNLGVCCLLAVAGAAHGEEKTPCTDLYGDPLPHGAIARLGMSDRRNSYHQHLDEDLTFSADGKQLISCGCDAQVRFWDAATGELLRCQRLSWTPHEDQEQLEFVTVSPGGAKVGASDRRRVYQFDASTGKEIGRLPAKRASTDSLLTFSPNGKLLVVQGYLQDAEGAFAYRQLLWNVAERNGPRVSKSLDGGLLKSVVFTPDGKYLAGISEGADDRIYLSVWDTASGKEIRSNNNCFPHEHLYAQSLSYSPDGKTLVVATSHPKLLSVDRLFLVDAATLKKKATLKAPDLNSIIKTVPYLSIPIFSPDGRTLAAICEIAPGEARVLLWDVPTLKFLRLLPGKVCEPGKLAFSPDGKTLAGLGRWTHEIRLWDMASGRLRSHRPRHEQAVRALAVSPDGKMIASGGGRKLRLWDARTSRPLHVLETAEVETVKPMLMPMRDEDTIRYCLFSPDSKRVISVSGTNVIQMWDVATGRELRRFAAKRRFQSVYAVGMSADGKRLFVTAEEETTNEGLRLYIWDAETGKLILRRPYRVEVLPSGDRVSNYLVDRSVFTADGERMSVWFGIEEVSSGRLVTALPKGLGRQRAFSPDGRFLAATLVRPTKECYDEKGLCIIETVSGEEIFLLDIGQIEHFTFTADSRGLVVADKDDNLCLWDIPTRRRLCQMAWWAGWPEREIVPARICSLAVLPGGRVVTGMFEGDILVWGLPAATEPARKPAGKLDSQAIEVLWSDLTGDADKASRAIYQMMMLPAQTVPFLKDHLRPVAALDADRITRLLADLDSSSFEAREKATHELKRLRHRAEPLLRRTLADKPTLELRRRVEAILADPQRLPAEALRTLRAIVVLERIGTTEARRVLEKLAVGVEAPETRAAEQALKRLKYR